jgi:hypothetical protein
LLFAYGGFNGKGNRMTEGEGINLMDEHCIHVKMS